MPTRYTELPAGTDENTLIDIPAAELAARYPEAVNERPYTSPIADRTDRSRTRNRGGAR